MRSEKVRNVIGKVPPRLVSLGTVVITIIVLALAVAFYKIPYPISIEVNGDVINQGTVQVLVPYKYLYLFDEPRTAHLSFEGNDDASYNCNIISHNAKLIHREDGNYFYGYSHSEYTETKFSYTAKVYESRSENYRQQQNVVAAGIWIVYVRIPAVCFWMHIVLVSIRFYAKVLIFIKFLL